MDSILPPNAIDRTFNPTLVNLLGIVLMPILGSLIVIPYVLVWHEIPFQGFDPVFILVSLIPSTLVHELLHAVGYRLCGARWQDIKFGFLWKALQPYAHCKIPLGVWAYRFGGALPGIVLGVIPGIFGVALHNPTLTIYATAMFIAAAGDVLVLVALIPVRGRVQDHPSKPGFMILQ
jgi:hypothetical protein